MKTFLNVIGIQADLVWKNPNENRKLFEQKITNLDNDVDLIILPEMFTSGFTMQPNSVCESMNGKTMQWMQKMANKKSSAILGSIVIKENNRYYNRLIFVYPSGELEFYDKKHTFTLAGEDKAYEAGSKKVIITYKGWKICPLICYDLRFPVWARNTEDYDLLIYVANWPITRVTAWSTLLKARAIENMSYVIGINRVGVDANNYQYSGNSCIVDYLGDKLASLPDNEQGNLAAKLDFNKQQLVRNKLGFLKDRDTFQMND